MIEDNIIKEDYREELKGRRAGILLQPENLSPEKAQVSQNKDLMQQFVELCLDDYRSRPKSRKIYGRLVSGLLITQNAVLYFLIIFLSIKNIEHLQHLQWLFSVLVSGTLVETYFVFNHVIRWLFNEVDYKSFVYPHTRFEK